MKKVLLAEDHAIVVKGLKIIFETEFVGYSLDVVKNGGDLMKTLQKGSYQAAIIDLHLEDGDTLHLLADLVNLYPGLQILIFSASSELLYAQKLYKIGVKGFLNKQSTDTEVISALRQVLDGNTYMSESFKGIITASKFGSLSENPFDKLSHRESEVMTMLVSGRKSSEICQELNLQASTVATYKMKIFSKLNIKNVLELKELSNNFDHRANPSS
jgi:two-component system invasion response regulator UvrY